MSSREYSSCSSSSSPSIPEDSLWEVVGRPRTRSQRMSPEEETPVTTPTPNVASEVEFPSLPAVVKRR